MNPFGLDATGLMVWGLVAHLVADWPLQNDWMANCKASVRHPAGYVHAAVHGLLLAPVFGWVAVLLAVAHFLIDLRTLVAWWSRLVRQTQPGSGSSNTTVCWTGTGSGANVAVGQTPVRLSPVYDVGLEVRFWTDQVFHIVCIAIVALVVS